MLSVYSKTFPAGTISIPGNNGVDGSFLIFLERPSSTNGESQYVGCFGDDGARNLDYGPTASAGTGYTSMMDDPEDKKLDDCTDEKVSLMRGMEEGEFSEAREDLAMRMPISGIYKIKVSVMSLQVSSNMVS